MSDPVISNGFTNGERIDSYNQEYETSSDDSISLLHDLEPIRGRGIHAESEIHHSSLQTIAKVKENKSSISLVKTPSGTEWRNLTECVASGENVPENGKMIRRRQLQRRECKDKTVLHRTCRRGDVACVKALLQNGICVNMEDYAGGTALHEACKEGHVEVVQELLNAGANVNATNHDGTSPLHDAVACGHYQVVEILLWHGSKPCDRNELGVCALDMAEREDIKELLLASSSIPVQHGEIPTEAPCREQPLDLLSICSTQSDTATIIPARQSADGDRAIQFAEFPMRKIGTTTDYWKQSTAIKKILKDVAKKQVEISTWTMTGPEDGVGYYKAFTEILTAVTEVLARQHLEKHQLTNKYKSMSSPKSQSLVRIQLISLATRQRNIVAILEKQRDLIQLHDNTTKFTIHPTSHISQAVQDSPGPLMQKVTISSQNVVKFFFKGRCLQSDGFVNNSLSPELQLHSVTDDNIPVSPSHSCVQDKRMFHEKCLSHPRGKRPESKCSETTVQHGSTSSTPETVITVSRKWNHIMNIKTIYLVADEELIRNALLDNYWGMLIRGDPRLGW
ncbi:ankyrin repeat domain-containing protein 31-like [Stigmatopora argus]